MLRLLVPDERAHSVVEIDPATLADKGVRGIILDLDDTLVEQFECNPTEEIQRWLAFVKQHQAVVILTNNRHRCRVAPIATRLGVPFICCAFKPLQGGFRKALKLLGLSPLEVAVIGDQLFTDVLGGRRLGAYVILVQPLTGFEKNWGRRVMRWAEVALLDQGPWARRARRSVSSKR